MLDTAKLEKVRHPSAGRITARCPACQDAGADRKGQHLVYWPETGKFACAAHPGDRTHRQRIWQLAGVPEADSGCAPRSPTPREVMSRREAAARARHAGTVAGRARREAARIFTLDWQPAALRHESPVVIDGTEPEWHLLLSSLYPPRALLWTGHPHQSGPGYADRFQIWPHWMNRHPGAPPAPMTCPDTFLPGTISRAAAFIHTSPYLVVEADEALGRKPVTAADRAENIRRNLCILRWLRDELRWPLHAVIHTGGKSCHGWFTRPPESHLAELRTIAPALGIDAAVFAPAHPVRLPGVPHETTGLTSQLLYLHPPP